MKCVKSVIVAALPTLGVMLLIGGLSQPARADARSDAAAFCSNYNAEKGVRICESQRCPCGRATFEAARFDAPRLQKSRCSCVNKRGYEAWKNKPPESQCSRDSDCNDGVWCNGPESCDVTTWTASDGTRHRVGKCRPGAAPCATPGLCREEGDFCETPCEDKDGDGFGAASCGGGDCDDRNANRYPGNTEVCDAQGIDEDCDPTTVGNVDRDGDGFISAECR